MEKGQVIIALDLMVGHMIDAIENDDINGLHSLVCRVDEIKVALIHDNVRLLQDIIDFGTR